MGPVALGSWAAASSACVEDWWGFEDMVVGVGQVIAVFSKLQHMWSSGW